MNTFCIGVSEFGKSILRELQTEYDIDIEHIIIEKESSPSAPLFSQPIIKFTPNNLLFFKHALNDIILGRDVIFVYLKNTDLRVLEAVHDVAYQSRCFLIAMLNGDNPALTSEPYRYCDACFKFLPNSDITLGSSFMGGMYNDAIQAFASTTAVLIPLMTAECDADFPFSSSVLEELFTDSNYAALGSTFGICKDYDGSLINRMMLPLVDKINHIGTENIKRLLLMVRSGRDLENATADKILDNIHSLDINCNIFPYLLYLGHLPEDMVIVDMVLAIG